MGYPHIHRVHKEKEKKKQKKKEKARRLLLNKTSTELGKVSSQKLAKLTDVYLEGTITKEIFEQKAQHLRNEEGELRIKIERMELQLIEKEESKDYLKRAEEVAKSADSIKENLHPSLRKELLRLIFKKVLIENKKVTQVVLFHPFDALYPKDSVHTTKDTKSEERGLENCQILQRKQAQMARRNWSYVLRPSDARWEKLRMTVIPNILVMYGIEN